MEIVYSLVIAFAVHVAQVAGDEASCTEGDRVRYPTDLTLYYQCIKGTWMEYSCYHPGWTFREQESECKPPDCTEGVRGPHPQDKHKYYQCEHGQWVEYACWRLGWIFSEISFTCQERINSFENSYNPNSKELTIFELVRRRRRRSPRKQQPQLSKDESILTLLVNGTSTPPRRSCGPPSPCPLGQYFSDNCDCRKFYQCDHGGAVHKDCGPGTAFNRKEGICDWEVNVPLCKVLLSDM